MVASFNYADRGYAEKAAHPVARATSHLLFGTMPEIFVEGMLYDVVDFVTAEGVTPRETR